MPLLLAALVYGVMWIWHRGVVAVHDSVVAEQIPTAIFLERVDAGQNRARQGLGGVPHPLERRNAAGAVLACAQEPFAARARAGADADGRLDAARRRRGPRHASCSEADNYWRAEALVRLHGECPTFPRFSRSARAEGAAIDLDDVTFYVGHETIVPRDDGKGVPHWQEAIFALMVRNSARISDYLKLPCDHVVEIGREIEI